MASIEMKNLRSFPMEKLCLDLKLEALEQMEPRGVYELAKVNQGFQGMLVSRPWIVFGEYVYRIQFYDERIRMMKFSNSKEVIELNLDRLFFHFYFVKKIRSCDQLWLGSESKETLERFFSNFHASIKKEALLAIDCGAFNDQVIKDWVENFMVGPQLKDCENIGFDFRTEDSFGFCYNALLKAEIKNVSMRTWGRMDLIVQQIITNGIPSNNPEAVILLGSSRDLTMDLSQYPGMRHIDGEMRRIDRLVDQANDLLQNFGWFSIDFERFRFENFESSMFCQRIDSTKDCIFLYAKGYTVDGKRVCCFLAFYVPVD